MGRAKYDINLKPIAGTNHYQIRFTNKEAIDVFTKLVQQKVSIKKIM